MSAATVPPDVLAELARFDSPTVTNVIDLIAIRSRAAGYVNPSIKAVFPDLPPAVGYAVTATFRSAHPGEKVANATSFLDMIKLIDASPKPRFIVVQDLDEPIKAMLFGELMAAAWRLFDCRGVLTNGACREVPRLAKLDFPCWVSSTVVSHAFGHLCELNVPVTVGGLDVKPGDLLHGDGSGVVNIPVEIAPALPKLCQRWLDVEGVWAAHIAKGDADLDKYIAMTAQFKAGFGELAEEAAQVIPAERRMV